MSNRFQSRALVVLGVPVLALALVTATANADTIYVPEDYPTIQAAIDAAADGDEIIVAAGTYVENINLLGKAIELRSSDGPQVTIIDGSGDTVVTCESGEGPQTLLDGFTIAHGSGQGGGMSIDGSSPTVEDCIIRDNQGFSSGGGVLNSGGAPTFNNCAFIENWEWGHVSSGAGIANVNGLVMLSGCQFISNMVEWRGGAIANSGTAIIDNCLFSRNGSYYQAGGAIYNAGAATITNCLLVDNFGTALYSSHGELTVRNCTFTKNYNGRAILSLQVRHQISNCIIWDNPDGSIWGYPTVGYSCVAGGCEGVGNIDQDPLFADPDNDDFHLTANSPCVDAGDPDFEPDEGETDMDGEERVQFCRVDMGADESPFYADCNDNGLPDACEAADGTVEDCNENLVPDECIELELDCNENLVPDECDIGDGTSLDCNENGIPDECEPGGTDDCNGNGVTDFCDVADGTSQDCNDNWIPDECEEDCNGNAVPDECDLAEGTSEDCNANDIPDECDVADGTSEDCNENVIPDECEVAQGTSHDCNANGIPDECDIASGFSEDCDDNGWPDECMVAFSPFFRLKNLDGTNGFVMPGPNRDRHAGRVVSGAGDVNNDGIADVIVGAGSAYSWMRGTCYVVFGGASVGSSGVVDLRTLDGTNGFVIIAPASENTTGGVVSDAGDVNGDGVDDLLIGGWHNGYIIFGASGIGSGGAFQLADLDGSNGFVIESNGAASLSGAGDCNGDGFDDVIIGAPSVNEDAGESYVVFGGPDVGGGGALSVEDLDGTNGFVINGINAGDRSGTSVSTAGDVNGDAFDDVIIGARRADGGGLHRGESYVVFGGPFVGSDGVVNLADLDGSNGFVINGQYQSEGTGRSVSGAGDVNQDGFGDLIIGGVGGDHEPRPGYVVFGGPSVGADGTVDLADLDGSDGFEIVAPDLPYTADTVSDAGDVNGDGIDDVILGSPPGDPEGVENAGESFVIFGAPALGQSGTLNVRELNGRNGFALYGIDYYDGSGWSVSAAGDVNGDALDDVIVGAPLADQTDPWREMAGEAYLFFGRRAPLDCNENGIPDECDIADGTSEDMNCNGIPDECECLGDLDGDWDIDQSDLGIFLADWECSSDDCLGDIDGDGDTDYHDLLILLAHWGEGCP